MRTIKENKQETPSSIYLMHKYWGKKPSKELRIIIDRYSKKGDCILDPFAGFGGLGIEGVLMGRNTILNDLNPVANFIADSILDVDINLKLVKKYFESIKKSYKDYSEKWYSFNKEKIITILRDNNDNPLKLKLYNHETKKTREYKLNDNEIKSFIEEENIFKITSWYPNNFLIKNSRISAKKNMKISDLFSKRELICQVYLYNLIDKLPDSSEKKLLKFAFTSNLANCSKLVPPITSRGEMSQGAWMTGFYIGKRYLENNVFHYFENRVNKIIKGKQDYLELYKIKKDKGRYQIFNNDAKRLPLENNSIDFVFTDFPYGDTVPYFEQSQLWNAWLKNKVDYENEIVISNSSERKKDNENFSIDIELSIKEISRVLKNNSYFVFTFHSLNGTEWEAISNALLKNDFEFVDCEMLLQKTFTPRQLNRKITVKGDLLVSYKKNSRNRQMSLNLENITKLIEQEIKQNCKIKELYDTNELITLCVKCLLKYNFISKEIDFIELIKKYFKIDDADKKKWRLKNEI
ncbi:DNA methyltransferase [Parvimonas micra]|uniref:DNA methyltransferase n=1 Tax=Parvimonas micra TaxID=33033 RepID=UPI0013C2B8C7|nr:DNA methyltransferase [Parvimonas micra]MEB3060170.1 DNA methyltransferase [Parvimonas micra]MEB3066916.1 DNA methyltransferase [Parvimonas micra]